MKKFIVLDNRKIRYFLKIIFLISLIYFLKLFIQSKINLIVFTSLIYLFFIHYFLFYVYFFLQKEKNYIPIYPLIFFYHLVTFSIYFYFNQELAPIMINNKYFIYPDIIFLIKLFSLSLIFFSLGYFILNLVNLKKISFTLNQIRRYETYLITAFLLFIPLYYLNHDLGFIKSNILSQLKQPIFIFILSYLQIKYLLTKKFFFLLCLIIILISLFVIEVSFGATVFPFMMISVLLLLNFYKKQEINLVNILLIFLSIYVVHSLKYDIRVSTWSTYKAYQDIKSNENKINPQTISSDIFNRVKKSASVYMTKGLDEILNGINVIGQKNRLFHANTTLQIATTQTPNIVNFYEGKSYKNLLFKFVPRFLYEDKPKEEWGNFWGKRYKMLSQDDFHTSWNFPILTEFYANFGVKGIIIGMFFLGLIIKILLIFLSFNFEQPVLLSMASTIMINFFFLESNLSLTLGIIIQQLLFFSAIIFSIYILSFLINQIRKIIFLNI